MEKEGKCINKLSFDRKQESYFKRNQARNQINSKGNLFNKLIYKKK